jgi:membrane protein DedA with SNARE-associated domain
MDFFLYSGVLNLTYSMISDLISAHGYLSIFFFMLLEAASFPIPSEVVLPIVGYFAAEGAVNPFLGFAVAILGGIIGMGIDYYIAYFLGKEVVYKHLRLFHIKKEQLLSFDEWFEKNGEFAVFVSRLIPLVRGLINFPAGFAEMPLKKFFAYSILGSAIWDAILMGFGYYVHSVRDVYLVMLALIVFSVALCVVYLIAMKKIRKKKGKAISSR